MNGVDGYVIDIICIIFNLTGFHIESDEKNMCVYSECTLAFIRSRKIGENFSIIDAKVICT